MGLESIQFGGGDTNPMEVVKSLLTSDDIEMKTDLNMTQIRVLVELKWYEELKKPENKEKSGLEIFNNKVVPYLLKLMPSIKRLSRKEIVDIFQKLAGSMIQETNLIKGGKPI